MRKVFKALGVVTATIDLGIAGKSCIVVKTKFIRQKRGNDT